MATFASQDEVAHVAVLRAEGRETRGQGNANATITATLVPDGDGTAVTVVTDLQITGKVAQFGRGVLADVSAKLLGQFVECLEKTVLVERAAGVRSRWSRSTSTWGIRWRPSSRRPSSPISCRAEPEPARRRPPSARSTRPSRRPSTCSTPRARPWPSASGPILAAVAILWILKKLLGRRR